MASTLTWPQLRLTLEMLLPESGSWTFHRGTEILQFLGSFSAAERASMEDMGLSVAAMAPAQQQFLISEIRRMTNADPPSEFDQARFFLTPLKEEREGRRRTLLEVRLEKGIPLWRTVVDYLSTLDKEKREKRP